MDLKIILCELFQYNNRILLKKKKIFFIELIRFYNRLVLVIINILNVIILCVGVLERRKYNSLWSNRT